MTNTLIFLTALSVAALAPFAQAQTGADSVKTDSAEAVPEKKGGLFGRVKKLAGNKNVQNVAKGVACSAVPGAAAVSAATGKGGCMNSLSMMGEGKGGVAGAAAGAAAGAVIGAVGSPPAAATAPTGAAMQMLMPAAMPTMPTMPVGMPGMKLNEAAAAKCFGITVEEWRTIYNPTPDAAQAKRLEAIQTKMMAKAQLGRPAGDMEACSLMWQP